MANERDEFLGRRQALQLFGAASGLALFGSTVAAAETAAPLSCKDKNPLDETQKSLRRALQYKEKFDLPEKKCSLCAQFEAAKYGACGGCKVLPGVAVNPDGTCLSFAPQTPAGPAKPGPAKPAPIAKPAPAKKG